MTARPATPSPMVRWHTQGRRQPVLVGKDISGRKIPGGPYIVWQAAALPVAPLMWVTRQQWASGMTGLAMYFTITCVTGAVFWLIGRIDFADRNPVVAGAAAVSSLLNAATAHSGHIRGSRLRVTTKPRRHRAHVMHTRRPAAVCDGDVSVVEEPALPGALSDHHWAARKEQGWPETGVPQTTGAAEHAGGGRRSPLETFLSAAGKV